MSSFSMDDIRRLEKTISIREQIIDNIVGVGKELPTKARDIDSITNLLESVDRSIFAKAKINIEDSTAKVNEETKEVLKSLLIELHNGNSVVASPTSEPVQAPAFTPTGISINEGELVCKLDNVDVNKFLEQHSPDE